MEDYFDRVQAQLGALTKDGAHLGARAGRGRWRRRRWPGRGAIPVLASALVVVVVAALLVATHAAPRRPSGVATRGGLSPATPSRRGRAPGPAVPATYGRAACANAAAACNPQTGIPAAMHRGMEFGLIKVARQCRATRITRIRSSYVGGAALGASADPIRLVIDNRVDRHRRTITLGSTQTPGWTALDVIWLAAHAYQGPFVIRARSLLHSGPIRIGNGGPPPAGALVVAAGPTINSGAGYRTLPSSIWVRHPGCYGLQVDGLNFTGDFVVHLVAAR